MPVGCANVIAGKLPLLKRAILKRETRKAADAYGMKCYIVESTGEKKLFPSIKRGSETPFHLQEFEFYSLIKTEDGNDEYTADVRQIRYLFFVVDNGFNG